MKALVFRGPGSMPLEDRPDPKPGPGEAVVAIRASGICGSDVPGFAGATVRRRAGVVHGLLAARQRGAGSIIVTDRDPHRLGVARLLGADQAIDVGRTDPVAAVATGTRGRGADVVFEAVGITATVAQSIAVARPGGQVTWIGNSPPDAEIPIQQPLTHQLTVRGAYGFIDEFELAADALAAGWIDARQLIECVAPLDEGEALFRQLAAGTLSAVKVVLAPNADR